MIISEINKGIFEASSERSSIGDFFDFDRDWVERTIKKYEATTETLQNHKLVLRTEEEKTKRRGRVPNDSLLLSCM